MATNAWSVKGLAHLLRGDVDLLVDTIHLRAYTAAAAPNQDTVDYRDDLGANELSGGNYTAQVLANKTVTDDAATNEARFDHDDVTYANLTAADVRYLVYAKIRGGASSADEVLGWVDLGAQAITASDLVYRPHTTGGLKLVAA